MPRQAYGLLFYGAYFRREDFSEAVLAKYTNKSREPDDVDYVDAVYHDLRVRIHAFEQINEDGESVTLYAVCSYYEEAMEEIRILDAPRTSFDFTRAFTALGLPMRMPRTYLVGYGA